MARLTGRSTGELKPIDFDCTGNRRPARGLCRPEGAHSLVATPDEQVFVNLSGTPGMGHTRVGRRPDGSYRSHGRPGPEHGEAPAWACSARLAATLLPPTAASMAS